MRGFCLGVKEKTCLLSDRGVVHLEKAQIREFTLGRCLIRRSVQLGQVHN